MNVEAMRLHRFLAAAGKGSRRACEGLIDQGRVMVDGEVVREQGTLVVPGESRVELDGEPVKMPQKVYYLVNKPKGYVCTNAPQDAPMRVIDLLPPKGHRLFVAGRLDRDSDGLVFVTNDGDVAQILTHPSHGALKTYKVRVRGVPDHETLAKLRQGVHIAEGKVKPKKISQGKTGANHSELTVVLGEGKNREVRRIFAGVGHPVSHLTRVAIGGFMLEGLEPGKYREVRQLTVTRELDRIAENAGKRAAADATGGRRKPAAGRACGSGTRRSPGGGRR